MAQTSSGGSSFSGNEKPGDKRDPKEIANQLAGYTGFTDLADLRRFLVSRPMLEVTTEILKDPPLANVLWVDVVPHFDSCLRLGGVQTLEEKYGENINLRNAFPKISHPDWSIETTAAKNRPNRAHRMAAWIFRLRNRIASYEKQDSSGRQAKYEKALNSFKGAIRNQETIIPHCDSLLVNFPVLGPIMELNEINQVRPYHRVYHLWLHLHTQSFMVSRSSGPRYLFDLCYPFVPEPVLPGFFPDHTREIINASVPNSRKRTQELLEPKYESLQRSRSLSPRLLTHQLLRVVVRKIEKTRSRSSHTDGFLIWTTKMLKITSRSLNPSCKEQVSLTKIRLKRGAVSLEAPLEGNLISPSISFSSIYWSSNTLPDLEMQSRLKLRSHRGIQPSELSTNILLIVPRKWF
jgi:hypothetical protein